MLKRFLFSNVVDITTKTLKTCPPKARYWGVSNMTKYLSTLDRYILRKYLSTFAFVMLMLTLISCVIDLGEKIEKFKIGRAHV